MAKLTQALALNQRQLMTFALHQALRVLQMPQLELAEWMQSEIEQNPLLDPLEKKSLPAPLDFPAISTLQDLLLAQAREAFSEEDLLVALSLIGELDEKGWITSQISPEEEKILKTLQTFDPPGICARNLQECLLLQLQREASHPLGEKLLKEHYEDLLHGRFSLIQKRLHISPPILQEVLSSLARLRFRPAASFDFCPTRPLFPDITIRECDGIWQLQIGEEILPAISLRTDYLTLDLKGAEKETMRRFATSAKWLQRCLKRRKEVLKIIGHLLVQKQTAWLRLEGEITPISVQELSLILHVHPTTAWRAVSNKVLASPRGMIPLERFFFESAAAQTTKEILKNMILQEDKSNPLTDEELALQLQKKGIDCARRTVAKYRKELSIASAMQRKALGTPGK